MYWYAIPLPYQYMYSMIMMYWYEIPWHILPYQHMYDTGTQ